MSVGIPMERMTPEEIERLRLRYSNRDGTAEVLCSKAWAHITLQDAEITRLEARVAELEKAMEKVGKTYPANAARLIHNEQQIIDFARAALNPSQEKAS